MKIRGWIAAYPHLAIVFGFVPVTLLFLATAFFHWSTMRSDAHLAFADFTQRRATAEREERAAALASVLEPYEARLAALDAKLDRGSTEGQWLSGIQSLAERNAVRLESFKIDEGKTVNGYKTRSAYLELAGDYGAVRKFIAGVEQLPFATVIGNAILERGEEGGRRIRTTLELFTFSRDGKNH